nr:aminoacyl-tRNA synthetase, class 1a, anticodon-binding [Tanacetum cinerariifolium]
MPTPDQPQDYLSTPPRQQTSDPNAPVFEHGQSLNPNIASFSRTHKTDDDPFTNVEDEPLGGSFHMSPPRSTQATPAGQTSGGAEDLITLTDLSSIVSTLVHKVNSLETQLKDHKRLFKDVVGKLVKKVKAIEVKLRTTKRNMVVSDSDQEEGGKQDVDLDALLALANAAVTVDSNIPPGGASNNPTASTSVPVDVPTSANVPTGSTSVHADVPTSVASAGVSNKGKTLMVEEDITVKERTFKQMKDDRLHEQAAKRLHDEEQAQVERQRAELQRRRQQEVLASAMYYTEADWINIMAQVEANASLFKTLMVVSLPKSSGTRRKSLGRKCLTKSKSKLKELDLDTDDETFIKVVSNEDSEDEAPLLWSAFVGWEVITTPLGDINALYRIDRSTAHFTTLREILHMVNRQDLVTLYGLVVKYYENHLVAGAGLILWGDLQVLFDSHEGETVSREVVYMFADVSYPFSVKLMERMLKHKLEIDKDVVGNDMTTAEQLIQFIKNQLAAAQVSPA